MDGLVSHQNELSPHISAILRREKNSVLAFRCAIALWQIDRDKSGAPVLLHHLLHGISFDKVEAAATFIDMGPSSLPHFLTAYKKGDSRLRMNICSQYLPKLGKVAIPHLIQFLLTAKRADTRRSAVYGLSECRPQPAVITALQKALDDTDKTVRSATAKELGKFGLKSKQALPQLRKMMRSDSGHARVQAALAVWRIAKDPESAKVLIERFPKSNTSVQSETLMALAILGPEAEEAIPLLLQVATDENRLESLREEAIRAMARVGKTDKRVQPVLQKLKSSENLQIRKAARQTETLPN